MGPIRKLRGGKLPCSPEKGPVVAVVPRSTRKPVAPVEPASVKMEVPAPPPECANHVCPIYGFPDPLGHMKAVTSSFLIALVPYTTS